MEIYDRVQAETTKAGLSRSDGVGDAFTHELGRTGLTTRQRLVLGVTGVSPRQRFPKEVCAHRTLGHHGHVCLSRGTSQAGTSGRQAQRTLLESQRAAALQGPGDRLAPDSFLPHGAVTWRSISRTFWSGGMSSSFRVHVNDTPRTWASLNAFEVLVLQTHTFNRTEKLQSFHYNQILARFLTSL